MKLSGWRFCCIWLCLLSCEWAHAQVTGSKDSLLYHLKLINGNKATDSIHFKEAVQWISLNQQTVLINDKNVLAEISRTGSFLTKKQYSQLEAVLFITQLSGEKAPNDLLIRYGRQFMDEHKPDLADKEVRYIILNLLRQLRVPFRNSDSIYAGIEYYNLMNKEFLAKNDSDVVTICYNVLGGIYNRLGLIDNARYSMLKSLDYLNDNEFQTGPGRIENVLGRSGKVNRYSVLGSFEIEAGKPAAAYKYLSEGINNFQQLKHQLQFGDGPFMFMQMAICQSELPNDSSLYYFDKTYQMMGLFGSAPLEYAYLYMHKSAYFLKKNILDSSRFYIRKSIALKDSLELPAISPYGELSPLYVLAGINIKSGEPEAAIKLLLREIREFEQLNTRRLIIKENKLLAEAYSAAGMYKEGQLTLAEVLRLQEALDREKDAAKAVSFDIEKKMQAADLNIARLKAQDENNRKSRYYLYGISVLLGLFAITLAFAIYNKQKSNSRLTDKNNEITDTLEKLKQTQSQLIHAEKMASLGELTAGIAHEIQNPLNFVNNFSEVNIELLDELKGEISKGNYDAAVQFADDVKANQHRINEHGKRADLIVKGMLQHSRNAGSQKEPTNINNLADEFLRLAYHGLRAKDKLFNTALQTDFDETIGKVNIVPQEIGRVFLNLVNNAFYSVAEKKRQMGESYQPIVSIITKRSDGNAEIVIRDNGTGIPDKIKDKIFQPFFTTKPTGEGTGLGLSLSYEIIKAHGGRLEVQTSEGIETQFIIYLPI